MKVILKENIENLGKKGDIVKVAAGYGRNYLIPKKFALEVTPKNQKMIEIEQKALQKGLEQDRKSYQELIERLNQVQLSFTRKAGEKDVLFGSVSLTDIKEALDKQGFEIEKKKIQLDEPIKRLGNYTIPIKIFYEERAEIKVGVLKEGEEKKAEKEVPPADESEAEAVPDEKAADTVEEEKKEEPPVEEPVEEIKDEVPPEEKEEAAPQKEIEAEPVEETASGSEEEKESTPIEEKEEEPKEEIPEESEEQEEK